MENTSARVVMITGAAGNLGQAVADAFAARGDQLVLVGRHVPPGEGEPQRWWVAADLFDADQTAAAHAQAVRRCGRIDVLCHLAGGFRMGEAVHETSAASWDFLVDINCSTLLNATRAVVPGMIEQGHGKIITVGAFAAQKGAAGMGAYVASKSAAMRLTEALSAELRDKGINVNCVLPTIIDTPENRAAMPGADPTRWVAPAALAEVIVFLASDAARAIHGAALPVTGLS